jgi:hypothetical protein
MRQSAILTIVATAAFALAGLGWSPIALAAEPQPGDACDRILAACKAAGFVEGGGASGKGLWFNCIEPVMQGTPAQPALPRPAIAAGVIADCRKARPAFGLEQADAEAPATQVIYQLGAPSVFATYAQLNAYGFQWGPSDGQFGAIPMGDGRYAFYASAGAKPSCLAPGHHGSTQGTFVFFGTLDHLTGGDCKKLFGPGDAPPGWNFANNYAGGGRIVPFASDGRRGWFLTFHAEYQWSNPRTANHWCLVGAGPSSVPCFYSALGLAVSTDNGKTFRIAGEIYQPSEPLSAYVGGGTNRGTGYGSLIVADADGKPLSNPPPDARSAYFYLFTKDFRPDLPGFCGKAQCLGVARARYDEVVAAALAGDPHRLAGVFHKYDGASADPWSAPATSNTPDQMQASGRYAPLVLDGAGGDSVIYDQAFGVYLMVAQTQQGFVVRSSTDLLHWSKPGPTYHEDGRSLWYPTIVGETGDPTIAGAEPRVYFSSFPEGKFPNWPTAVFKSVPVKLMKAP